MDVLDKTGGEGPRRSLCVCADLTSRTTPMIPAFPGISSRPSAVTRAKSSQTPVRKLSATCNELGVRLEERDGPARELHDFTSELLVALDLQLRRLKELPLGTGSKAFGDVLLALGNTVSELHDEVRSVGNEGHFPPQFLNRELALMAAEFADRTGLVHPNSIRGLSGKGFT